MRPFAKRAFAVLQGVVPSNFGRKTVATLLKALDTVGGIAITTKLGARLVGLLAPRSRPVLCSGFGGAVLCQRVSSSVNLRLCTTCAV